MEYFDDDELFGDNWLSDIDFGFLNEEEKKSDGCFCKKCKDFFPYAEPNQKDGTLICYSCRNF